MQQGTQMGKQCTDWLKVSNQALTKDFKYLYIIVRMHNQNSNMFIELYNNTYSTYVKQLYSTNSHFHYVRTYNLQY